MGTLTHKTGDMFTTYAPALAHGVNTQGVMGAGIALEFKRRFPGMYEEYKTICANGSFHPGEAYAYEAGTGQLGAKLWVYNIASQEFPGANARMDLLEWGLNAVFMHADANGVKTIAFPRIGSGIGGLDEAEVEALIERTVSFFDVNVELWSYPK